MRKIIATLIMFFVINTIFAQLGNTCGIPLWNNSKSYSSNSYVQYNAKIYKTTSWNKNKKPDTNSNWVYIGVCNEQLLIDNSNLAYTNCANVRTWDNSTPNYNSKNLVKYNNGVYKATYWVAGTERPDLSDAYAFQGICVIPTRINPSHQNREVIVQPTLSNIMLDATITTHGFSTVQNKIKIKKINQTNYIEYNMGLTGNIISYKWKPPSYGDYNLQYISKNSVGVQTVVNRIIKIAISTPPNISLLSPVANTSFIQLNFESINISFKVLATDKNIKSIIFKDLTSNTSVSIPTTSSERYNYGWTPKKHGTNTIKIIITDTSGTTNSLSASYIIVDPSIQNILFSTLPNQLKAIQGFSKNFVFDKPISTVEFRNITITNYSINSNVLTINAENTGRTGLRITTADGEKYYVGLRIDYADGTVPRYPTHVSIGSVSEDIPDDVNFYNNGINNSNLLKNNRMDVRYIYINGGPINGWSSWQPDRATKYAKNSLKMGLIPFFIFYNIPDGGESYTTNLAHIQDPTYMTAYFNNLKLFLNQVKDEVGDEFFGVVLEPDFLGYMQQNSEPTSLATAVSKNNIRKNAGTLKTLVERINFEIDKKRINDNLNMEFGWQLNLWAKPNVAGLRGIIRETDSGNFTTKLQKIKQTASDIFSYAKKLGIMSANANFISIDKYGLDAMGAPANSTPSNPASYTWFWNNDHWKNYLAFVKQLHIDSQKHVILWQVPVGHINGVTTTNVYTNTNFKLLKNVSKHFEDSASNFFFGETNNYSNDLVRYNYFSQNKHNDSKMTVDTASKKITWGNHFEEVNESGVKLVLMGAGVGDSTDGIGDSVDPGATLTDDHYWVQKVQDYYQNHLTTSTTTLLAVEDHKYTKNKNFSVYQVDEYLLINNNNHTKNINVHLYNLQGKKLYEKKNIYLEQGSHIKINISSLTKGLYICTIQNTSEKISYKIIIH